jgi:hypothetical protein
MGLHIWSRGIAAILALAFLPATGCSWLFLQKPPPGPVEPAQPVVCTSSRVSPGLDTTGAVLLGLGGASTILFGITTPGKEGPGFWRLSPEQRTLVIASGLAVAGAATALAFSAANGNSTVAECRHLKEAQLSCLSGVEAACRSLEERNGNRTPRVGE